MILELPAGALNDGRGPGTVDSSASVEVRAGAGAGTVTGSEISATDTDGTVAAIGSTTDDSGADATSATGAATSTEAFTFTGAATGISTGTTGISATGVRTGATTSTANGSAFVSTTAAAVAAAPFLLGLAGSSGCTSRMRPSRSALRRTRSACASSMPEEWLLTPMPKDRDKSSASLLVMPSSLASSCTRIFAAKRGIPCEVASETLCHRAARSAQRATAHTSCFPEGPGEDCSTKQAEYSFEP
jgi:hypothetical protein